MRYKIVKETYISNDKPVNLYYVMSVESKLNKILK